MSVALIVFVLAACAVPVLAARAASVARPARVRIRVERWRHPRS